MPNLIDWSQVEANIRRYQEQNQCETRSIALGSIVIESLFKLPSTEVEECITDGPRDRGIDAVFIDESEERPVIHLFQTKCVKDFEHAENNFPSNEIDKMLSFIDQVLQKDATLQSTTNPLLWGKVQDIWEAFAGGTPSLLVHMVSNQSALAPSERKRLDQALARYRHFTVREHTLQSIAQMLIDVTRPRLSRELRAIDNQYFERVDGNIRGLIATVQASQLVEMIRDPDNPEHVLKEIFDENVRIYLTSKNKINRRIIASAQTAAAEFWYLNNGLTITCESLEYSPNTRAPLLKLDGVQIVNGGQTSNALFEAFGASPKDCKDVLVLVRIYETKRREMSLRIAESTNSQTPIRSRDLRSNDEVQRKLEDSFKSLGFYYERKEGQFTDKPKNVTIDALFAGQAYLAYFIGRPEIAGKDRGKIFGDLYELIFNDETTAEKILVPLRIFSPIEAKKKALERAIRRDDSYDTDHLFLIDGSFHLLYGAGFLCSQKGIDPSDVGKVLEHLDAAMAIVIAVVQNEIETDPAFQYKKFFKSNRSKERIEEQVRQSLAA